MAKTVLVASRLPWALRIENPLDPAQTVTLAGINSSLIVGAPYATTQVDEDFASVWFAANAEFPPVKSGALFMKKNATEIAANATEIAGEKTGLEPMPQDAPGIKKLES